MNPDTVAKWKTRLGLRGWVIKEAPDDSPPSPARTNAHIEIEYPTRQAILWAKNESDTIHELIHIVFAGLDDAFWRANPEKSLRALWSRREEQAVERLTRAFDKLRKSDNR